MGRRNYTHPVTTLVAKASWLSVIVFFLALFGCLPSLFRDDLAQTPAGELMERVMLEAREHYRDREDNCLLVANDGRTRLRELGMEAQVIVVLLSGRKNHAVVCARNGICFDNGRLSTGLFAMDELDHMDVVFTFPHRGAYTAR